MFDVNNGVLITKSINKKFHYLFTRRNNTPEQFEHFLETHYPKKFNRKIYAKNELYPWSAADFEKKCDYIEKRFKTSPEFFCKST
jgi:hypothetical protein